MNKIGTVEILKPRVYPLDAESSEPQSWVWVEPGRFDLYREGLATFWMMRGKLNRQGLFREGDGLFAAYGGDSPTEIEVVFPSRRFGPYEWAELLASPQFNEGEAQRLCVTVDADPS